MSRTTRTPFKRLALGLGLLLVLALAAFFIFAPGVVERSRNELADTQLPQLGDEAKAAHGKLQVVDMHADTLMWDRSLLKRSTRGHVDLPRLQEGNVALQVFSSVSKSPVGQNYESNSADSDNITLLSIAQLQPPKTWFSPFERSRFHAKKLRDAARRSDGALRTITSKAELEDLLAQRARGANVTGALFSVEGLQNLEGDINNLDVLFADGMRMAGLTHFFDNEAAGSMHGAAKGGLTDLGREAVARMEELGIVVDLAHASNQSIDEVLAMATRPVVFSHGGVQATCQVNRNLSDAQIRAVAATGGVIGIGYWDAAICRLDVQAVVDAIEHVILVGGLDSAALGSDFDGATEVAWDASQIALVTQELMNRGRSEAEIQAIMGGNTLRVLGRVLPAG
ncbi:dipeptidase [Glutamicibacter protophormiae]|uniref:Microsomal dipeptidase-like Zn-dependent dipeptidase n=1 Tax=Glutamicibacter protophormiae TaxID=37930 RepID=A0ABS4XQ99_GLUPR|nr:dipeptidase [Glutamicibacter protophormiae]MBP2398684.1 microsomal dipeptidase-like Zn-dependent dipeptidase [Glutamicibacter protophormiae]GGL81592.1 dipeptidase [Glutamicibacter protophormiae]